MPGGYGPRNVTFRAPGAVGAPLCCPTPGARLAPPAPDRGLGGFDVVHAINLDRSVLTETETLAMAARAAGARLVVTPLWWPLDRYVRGMSRMQALAFRAKGLGPVRALHDRRRESLRS